MFIGKDHHAVQAGLVKHSQYKNDATQLENY